MTRPVPQRTPSGSRIVARARRHLPAVLCMVAGGAWAQAPDEVAFDRPGIAFGTVVLERGGLAWEQGLPDFTSDRADGTRERDVILGSRLRLGLGANLELQLAGDVYAWRHRSGDSLGGSGDSSVSLKLALPSPVDGFGWALLADYGIASGEHPFTAGGSSRGLGATLAWDLAQGRGVALYLDWRDGAGGQAWTFSPSYTFYSGERLGGYVEAGFGHGEGGEQVAGGGLTWRASPRVQLDLSVLRGLDANSTDWQGGFGVSVALR